MFTLTPKADDDLAGIWQYSYETWGVEQADRYIDQLHACFTGLGEQRLAGTRYTPRAGYWRYLCQRHVIFYRRLPEDAGVEIVRVLHERMDSEQHLDAEA